MPVMRQLVCLVLLLCSGFVSGQRIEFFREDLVFTLDSSCFSVNGDYYFRNRSGAAVSYRIFYPVSKPGGFAALDTIVVFDVAAHGLPVPVEIMDSVASFTLNFPPATEKCVKIYYRQHHDGSAARYILMTTHTWHKPLEQAKYSLLTDKNITVSAFSITPDSSEDFGQTRIYFWKRVRFMPDVDFVFGFHKFQPSAE
jgi:hypothetical protein